MKSLNTLVGIGDVSRFLSIPAHTLRFWEKEFHFYINLYRTSGRQRRYDDDSISKLERIKHLLKIEGYSIAGAKRLLKLEAA
ncbi:MAG: MerR family transcriptional regulator [Fibrobacter sp.]|nr:MerR family transcriptional regulator [Fibrobacter sp.]